jgi:hypothetical protein
MRILTDIVIGDLQPQGSAGAERALGLVAAKSVRQ